jgi:flagellar basal-body rod modification protein FlgD
MVNGVGNINPTDTTGTNTTTKPAAADPLASESTFLQLLVTQLKNQDPANPQDGTQFVAQLAQFSGLEQQLQMRQDLDAIKQSVQAPVPPAATPAS